MDADYYYIHFENSYVATPVANSYTYNTSPPSNTQGFEAEGNLALTHGLSVFLNGTVASAKYVSAATMPELWVAGAPHDTETEGITYQNRNWDMGFFNKRVGSQWNNNTDARGNLLRQAIPVDPFTELTGSRHIRASLPKVYNLHKDDHRISWKDHLTVLLPCIAVRFEDDSLALRH